MTVTEYPTDGSGALDPVDNNDSSLDEEWWGDVSNPIGDIMEAAQGRSGANAGEKNGKIIPFPGAEAKKKSRDRENGASSKDRAAGAKKAGGLENAKALEGSGAGGKVVAFPGGGATQGATAVAGGAKAKGRGQKKGPVMAIIGLIISVGVMVFGSQALAPFGFAANALDNLNSLRTSMNRRSRVMRKAQLTNDGRNRSLTKVGIFSEKFKISGKMERRLGKQGITVEMEGRKRYLKYTDPDTGKTMAVAANSSDRAALAGLSGVDEVVDLDTAKASSHNFNVAQDKATRTIKGHIAGWFDKISASFHNRIGKNRNQHKDTKGDPDSDEMKQKVKDQVNENRGDRTFEDPDTTRNNQVAEDVTVPDTSQIPSDTPCTGCMQASDGKYYPTTTTTQTTTATDLGADGKLDETKARNQLEAGDIHNELGNADGDIGKALSARARKVMQTGGQVICMVSKAVSAIAMVTMALQVMAILEYATQFLEAIDNVKAGEETAALNVNMSEMATPGTTYGADGGVVREGTSGLSSPAWNAFFDGPAISADDEVAKTLNQEHVIGNAMAQATGAEGLSTVLSKFAGVATGASTMLAAYQACAVASMVTSVAGIVSDVADAIGVIGGFATFGISTLVVAAKKLIVWAAKEVAKKVAITAAMTIIGMIVPHIVNLVARLILFNFMDDTEGELGAYALASGSNVYMGRNMQSSSGLPGTHDQVVAQWRETQTVIAEEAEYDRATHSPFDITNKNTFLGSIAYALMPIGFAANQATFGGVLSKTLTTTSTMLSSLTGTKIYADEVKIATNLNDDCPSLQTLGLVGDAYCNPYYVSDFTSNTDASVRNLDPAEVLVQVCETDHDSFKDDVCDKYVINGGTASDEFEGVPEINPKSEFGKWMVACPMRTSQWGYVDEKIQGFIGNISNNEDNPTMGEIVSNGLGMVPVLGDAMDLLEGSEQLYYLNWNTGKNCIDPDYAAFSRYSEDQRWMENEGLIEKSATAAFMEEYYEQNPIDYSLEGQIAMYSGLSKEHVDETLGIVEYAYYVYNYDPSERIAMFEKAEPKYYYYEDTNEANQEVIAIKPEYVVYFDLRGRTYTV